MEDLRRCLKSLGSDISDKEREHCLKTIQYHKSNSSGADEFLNAILDSNEGALRIIKNSWNEPHLKTICKKLLEIIDGLAKNRNELFTQVQVDDILDISRPILLSKQSTLVQLCCSIMCNLKEKLFRSNIKDVKDVILGRFNDGGSKEIHFLPVLGVFFEFCPNQVQEGSESLWAFLVDGFQPGHLGIKEIEVYVDCFGRLLKHFPPPALITSKFGDGLKNLILKKNKEGQTYKKGLSLFEKSLEHIYDSLFGNDSRKFHEVHECLLQQLDKEDHLALDSPLLLAYEKLHRLSLDASSSSNHTVIWNHLWQRLSQSCRSGRALKVHDAKCLAHFTKRPVKTIVASSSLSEICMNLSICCTRLNKKTDEESYMIFCFCLESLFNTVGQNEDLFLKYRDTLENFLLFSIMMYKRNRHYMPASFINCVAALPGRELFIVKSIVVKAIVVQCSRKWLINETEASNLESIALQNFSELWSAVIFSPSSLSQETSFLFDVFMESIFKVIDLLDFEAIDGSVDVTVGHSDVTLFENLVSLLLDTFSRRFCDNFPDWSFIFIKKFVGYSMRFPLICGFHKLIALGLRIFEQPCNTDESKNVDFLQGYLDALVDNLVGYTGELFHACMAVITSVSVNFLRHSISKLVTPFQVWFSITHRRPESATEAVSTVFNWLISLGQDSMSDFLNGVIPFLRPFLKFVQGESPLKNSIGTEFMKLISCLTTEQCNDLLLLPPDSVALDTPLIDLKFDFLDAALQIKLEDLINPVIFLATKSNDNAEVTEACYLLRLIPLLIIDTGSKPGMSEETRERFRVSFGQIVPVLLDLACESSNEACFANSVSQLIHLTANEPVFRAFNGPLIFSLVEKILSSKNPEVVESCLFYLKILVDSLKSSPLNLDNDYGFEIILSAVSNNVLNDDYFRRRGACQIFNSVADYIFHKNFFIANYCLRLVCVCIKSLSAHCHEINEISVSLKKLGKIIRENMLLLANSAETRLVTPSLKDTEEFLLEHCSSTNLQCSRESQCCLLDILITRNNIQTRFSDQQLVKADSSLQNSWMALEADNNGLSLLAWHKALLASLNYYSWIIDNKITLPSVLNLKSSWLLANVKNFISRPELHRFGSERTPMIGNLRKDIAVSIFRLFNSVANLDRNKLLDDMCLTENFRNFSAKLLVQPNALNINFPIKEHSCFIEKLWIPLIDLLRSRGLGNFQERYVPTILDNLIADWKVRKSIGFSSDQLELVERMLVVSSHTNINVFCEEWTSKIYEVLSFISYLSKNEEYSILCLDRQTIGGIACLIQLGAVSNELIVDHLWEFICFSSSGLSSLNYALLRTFEESVVRIFVSSPKNCSTLLTRVIKQSLCTKEEILYFVQFLLGRVSARDSEMSLCISKTLNECYNELTSWSKNSPDRTNYLVETLYLLGRSLGRPLFFRGGPYEAWWTTTFPELSSVRDSHLVLKCYPYFTETLIYSDNLETVYAWAKDGLDLGLLVSKDYNLIPFVFRNVMMSVDELCELIDVIKMLPSISEKMHLTILDEALKYSRIRTDAPFKTKLVKEFVVPLIFELTLSSLTTFFGGEVERMYESIKAPFLRDASVYLLQDQIVEKTISFMLTEAMIDLIPPEDLFGDSSFLRQLGDNACDGFRREILIRAHDILVTDMAVDPSLSQFWRSLNCFALNTVATLFRKYRRSDDLLNKFIFTEAGGGKFSRITPVENYALPSYDAICDSEKITKKVFLTSQKFKKIAVSQSLDLTPTIATQECKLFDFIGLKKFAIMYEHSSTEILLSKDDIDSHEAMIPLCQLILQALEDDSAPKRDTVPKWMDSFRKELMNPLSSQNSRVFILRVVYNCRRAFKPYASHWIGPILLCLSLPPFKGGFSHFFVQLVLLLTVSWKGSCSPNGDLILARSYADRLLRAAVQNCESSGQTGSTAGLKILRKIVDSWGMELTIPYDLITEGLSKSHEGLKVCSVLYEKNIAPFQLNALSMEHGFLAVLLRLWRTCFSENQKTLLRSSSQLLGYVLWSLREAGTTESIQLEQSILQNVKTHLKDVQLTVSVPSVQSIQKFYPYIIETPSSFISTLVTHLSDRRHTSLHSSILEIIDVYTSANPDFEVYERLQDTIPFSSPPSDKIKLPRTVLNIHSHFAKHGFGSKTFCEGILDNIVRFADSKDIELQEKTIEILISLYWNIKKGNFSSTEKLDYIETFLLKQMFSPEFCTKNEIVTRFFADIKLNCSIKDAVLFLFKEKLIFSDQNALQTLALLFIQFLDQSYDKLKPLFSSPAFAQQNIQGTPRKECQYWRNVPNFVEIFTPVSQSKQQTDIDVNSFLGNGNRFWLSSQKKSPTNKLLRQSHEAVFSDLISSIVFLVAKQDRIAGILFRQFMNDLLVKLRQHESWDRLKIDLSKCVKSICEENEIKSAFLASILFELFYVNDISCPISNLASICWRKGAPEIGILMSERDGLLTREVSDEAREKKMSLAAEIFPISQFLLLYINLNESDIVDGAFNHLIESNLNRSDPLLKCIEFTKMAHMLGDWNYLNENMKPLVSNHILDSKSSMHAMLDPFITSEVYSSIYSSQDKNSILKGWLMNESQRSTIESWYPYVRLISSSAETSYAKARVSLEKILTPSLGAVRTHEYQDVHKFYGLNLKSLMDMFMFSISNTEDHVNQWPVIKELRFNKVCSTDHLHLFTAHQCFRFSLLEKCQSLIDDDRSDEIESIEDVRGALIRSMFDTSLSNSNVESAEKHLELMWFKKKCLKGTAGSLLSLLLSRHSFVKYEQNDSLSELHKAWTSIEPIWRSNHRDVEIYSHLAKLCFSYSKHSSEAPLEILELPIWFNANDKSVEVTQQALLYRGLDCLLSAVDLPGKGGGPAVHDELASFCEHILTVETEESLKHALSETLISTNLRSMALGSKRARMTFLASLRVLSEESIVQEAFKKESSKVPAWMFLEWLPQLLVWFNSLTGRLLLPILNRLFRSFPQQVGTSFELFLETHKSSVTNFHESGAINNLKACLRTENYALNKSFFDCAALVRDPRLVLNSYITKLINGSNPPNDRLVTEMKNKCFERHNEDLGRAYRVNDDFYEDIMLALVLMEADETSGNTKLKQIKCELLEISESSKFNLLEDYSPKLGNLGWAPGNIQVPDFVSWSFSKNCHPSVSIVKIDPKVKLLPSLRKPIKISFVGSDGNRHSLLVKSGEDLRQDQLCQQCFQFFNSSLSLSRNTLNLKIRTYNVIPIASEVGLIEWIDDTSTISSLINRSLTEEHVELRNNLRELHARKILKLAEEVEQDGVLNSHGFLRHIQLMEMELSQLASQLPSDLLKQSLFHLSSSPTQYYNYRIRFMRTYAALCGSHWVLGVTDRHLSNFLIDLNNGEVIGIDFGQVFGAGLQLACVSELVPFRMTPSFYHVYEPYFVEGIFCTVVRKVLQEIQAFENSLVNALEVCREDPTENIKHLAQLIFKGQDERTALASYYKSIVSIIHQKLDRNVQPVYSIITQLRNESKNAVLSLCYCDLLDSIEPSADNVTSLLDIARNNQVLAASHYTYEPWI